MENGTSLKQLIQGLMPEGVGVVQGVVQSVSPLKIKIAGDDKLIISAQNTSVPWQLTDYDTEVTIDWRTEDESGGGGWAEFAAHSHAVKGRKKIRVHNALKIGDKLHILAYNHGKQYYVLDRVAK